MAQTATEPVSDVDFLLGQAKPSTLPAYSLPPSSQPAVLQSPDIQALDTFPATITLSDGSIVKGKVSTTLDQPFRVYDEEAKKYNDVPIESVASIKSLVVWEQMEDEWRFAASGSDVKEFSGRKYPARLTSYTFSLKDGSRVRGSVDAPIYVESATGKITLILHKRDKGPPGDTLDKLIYVKAVNFDR